MVIIMQISSLASLNKAKTYLALVYGESPKAKVMSAITSKFAPFSERVPIHTAGLRYKDGGWKMYEASEHGKNIGLKPGVREVAIDVWKNIRHSLDRINIFKYELDINKLDEYIGLPYGRKNLINIGLLALCGKKTKTPFSKGMTCAEYISHANNEVSRYYNTPPHCITPAHYQDFFDSKGIKPVLI